uniref:Putative secreted protein n=1 Tax=Ixodes ricinus TaxID=34613 RepID=A0A6B0UIG1_IXORI
MYGQFGMLVYLLIVSEARQRLERSTQCHRNKYEGRSEQNGHRSHVRQQHAALFVMLAMLSIYGTGTRDKQQRNIHSCHIPRVRKGRNQDHLLLDIWSFVEGL